MENWKELLASFGLWLLVEDISDDGDGKGDNLQLTKDGELFVSEIQQELDKAREEGRKELLDSIIEGVTQLKDLVSMFNPLSPEIRAKQSGEIEAYNGLLEKLSKLTTK